MTFRAWGRWQVRFWPRDGLAGVHGRTPGYRWWRFGPLEVRRWWRVEAPFS